MDSTLCGACMCVLSHWIMSDSFVTSCTVAGHPPMSIGCSRQEYWSGLPFPPPGDLPDPGIEPPSPTLAGGFFITEPGGKPGCLPVCASTLREEGRDG